jgi:hypothetical protein
MRLATRLTRRPEACQWSKTNSCKRFAVWLKRSPDTTMLELTAPVLRNAATSRARLQTGRFCALSPPENNALAQPPRSSKAAFWRFSPVQRTDLEGQQRVHLKRPRDVSNRRPIAGFFRRAWVVNSVVFGWPGGKRSEGFRLLCVLNARRRRRTGWVEKDRTA